MMKRRYTLYIGLLLVMCTGMFTQAFAHELQPSSLEVRQLMPERYEVIWRAPIYYGKAHPARLQLPEQWQTVGELTVKQLSDSALPRRVVSVPNGAIDGGVIRFIGLEATITDVFVRFVWLDGNQTTQSTNSYAHWGNSVARRGNDWIKTSHYTDEKGARRQFETSQGAKGVQFKGEDHSLGVAKNKEGELFVGKDQNVYKRTDEGWMKQGDNGWAPVDTEAAKNKLNEKGVTRESAAENISNRRSGSDSMKSTRQDRSRNSNINQLNRDSRSRTYGNQRYNDFSSRQKSGSLYSRGAQSGGHSVNRPTRSSRPDSGRRPRR